MRRLIRRPEQMTWVNPIKGVVPRPYLGDETWPSDSTTPVGLEATAILKRFYCNDRIGRGEDGDALKRYLHSPDVPILVVWGPAGAGKSWFLRHQILQGDGIASTPALEIHMGIIDMLGTPIADAQAYIYRRLCPLIERHLSRTQSSVQAALTRYAQHLIMQQRGPATRARGIARNVAADEVSQLEAKGRAQEWMKLGRNGEYADVLLGALECFDAPHIFLVIDNLDRTTDSVQSTIFDIVARAVHCPRVKLIVPLRKSSELLADRFGGLHEQRYDEMTLEPLDLRKMLALRFGQSRDGKALRDQPVIVDGNERFTFPGLFGSLFDSGREAGDLILTLADTNAREALLLTRRLMESDQLKGLRNIGSGEHATACFMLEDTAEADVAWPHILNVFENNEGDSVVGNNLIRFRVLEFYSRQGHASLADDYLKRYFERLGYDRARIAKVVIAFIMAGIVSAENHALPEHLRGLAVDEWPAMHFTRIGELYRRTLLEKIWYWVAVKRGTRFGDKWIRRSEPGSDELEGEFITHTDLVEWLRECEQSEAREVKSWERQNAPTGGKYAAHLEAPHLIARRVLSHGGPSATH